MVGWWQRVLHNWLKQYEDVEEISHGATLVAMWLSPDAVYAIAPVISIREGMVRIEVMWYM